MAVSREDLLIAIEAQTGKATAALNDITKQLGKMEKALESASDETKKTSKAVTDTGASFVKVGAMIDVAKFAYSQFKTVMDTTVGAYASQIDAEKKLANALALRGKFTDEALGRFKEFADQMEEVSTLEGDVALNMAAQAAAMGVNEAQIQKLIKASAGLAAVNGKDVNTNFQMLLKTYKGVAGATEIMDREIQGLTATQLKNGAAVDILADKYGQFAEEEAKSFSGQAKQLNNALGGVAEAIGQVIAKTLNLDSSTAGLKDMVLSLKKTIEANMESIVLWGKVMISVVDDIIEVFKSVGAVVAGVSATMLKRLNQVIYGVQVGLNAIGQVSDEAVAATKATIEGLQDYADGAVIAFKEATEAIGKLDNADMENISASVDDVTSGAKKMQAGFKGAASEIQSLSDNGIKLMDELAKAVADLTAKTAEIGAGRFDVLKAQADAQRKQIMLLEEKLKKEGALTGAARDQIAAAKELIQVQMDKTVAEEQRKLNADMLQANKDQKFQLQQYGQLQQDIIENTLKHQLELIDAKEKELEREGMISDEIRKRFAEQRAMASEGSGIASKEAPSRELEAPMKAGVEIAKMISGSFEGLAGMASGVGSVVSAASAIVDFIPQMLDSITGLISKITDFPNVMLKAVQNLLGSVEKFISDFIPNIINFIDGFLETIVSFIERIPEMVSGLLEKIPDMLTRLIDKIPVLAERLVSSLVTMMPKIWVSMITFVVKDAPRIAIAMMKTFMIEMPKAIIRGLLEGGQELVKMIRNVLSGKGLGGGIKIDTKQIEKDLKKAMKNLTGQASQLFAVTDLADAAKNQQLTKNMTEEINEAGKKARDLLSDAWKWVLEQLDKFLRFLKEIWMFVYDTILKPFLDSLKMVWQFVYTTLLKPFLDNLSLVWQFIYNSVLKPAMEMIGNVWNTVIDSLKSTWSLVTDNLKAVWDSFKAIWQTMMDLFSGKISFMQAISEIWQNTWGFLTSSFERVVNYFRDVGQGIVNIFNQSWENMRNIFSNMGNVAYNMGMNIWNGLKDGLSQVGNFLQDILNRINPANIFERMFRMPDSPQGKVEQTLGINIPFANFAMGGFVPGSASAPGDSLVNDRIIALLSADEAVIPRSITQDPQLRPFVEALLDGSAKKMLPAFGFGGAVKSIGGAVSGAVSGGGNVVNLIRNPLGEVKDRLDDARETIAGLDPRRMWEDAKREAFNVVMKAFESNKFHEGGFVGGSGDVPSMLQDGEFVMSRRGVQNVGMPALNAMNQGGGMGSTVNNYNVELNLKVETTKPIDENFVRNTMYPIISENLKRDSLNGKLVLSKRGLF